MAVIMAQSVARAAASRRAERHSFLHVSAIIAAGGRGSRVGAGQPKQLLEIAGVPILCRSVEAFLHHPRVSEVVVALPPEILAAPPSYLLATAKPVMLVKGGARRQDSVALAFSRVSPEADLVVVHDAARPMVSQALIDRTLAAAEEHGAALAALRATDTVKRGSAGGLVLETVPRDQVYLAQTPQAFRASVLRMALESGADATDEATLVERAGLPVWLVEGDPDNVKITTAADVARAGRLIGDRAAAGLRIGNGYDLHRLVPGRPLILGGITIPFELGLAGHSDADVVCHAVTDAVLGAASLGDIGRHFPDSDPRWKGADSLKLLAAAVSLVREAGWAVANVDVTVIAERPKLLPVVQQMRASLAGALQCEVGQVSVKGKTNEGVDATGAGLAIAAHAVALIQR
jgi:2-C-methyl-D-erythritol 4-phosphate cytidylyltransferase/2-C-methyl-D-erythritol 2,4-cyclodiphosphate synthase